MTWPHYPNEDNARLDMAAELSVLPSEALAQLLRYLNNHNITTATRVGVLSQVVREAIKMPEGSQ